MGGRRQSIGEIWATPYRDLGGVGEARTTKIGLIFDGARTAGLRRLQISCRQLDKPLAGRHSIAGEISRVGRKDDKVGALILGGILIFFMGRCSVTEPVPATVPAALPVVTQQADDGALPSNAPSIDPVAENPSEPVRAVAPQRLAETQAALDDPEETEACGFKTVCRQMASCEEAQHYLNDCGLSRLDRDNDGLACESLC